MKTPFNFILITAIVIIIASCNSKINFPAGGYDYPADVSKIDTNVFYYPKDIANKKDSFRSSYYGYYWHKAFGEPNLSIRPQHEITFRLVYVNAFGATSIFTVTQNQIVVKKLLQGKFYPQHDIMKLDTLERLHLRILENNFPIEDLPLDYSGKKTMDSFAAIYPKLLDPHYYKYLWDKSSYTDTVPFRYSVNKIMISTEKFNSIVNQINAADYWKSPFEIGCVDGYLDGYRFTLEANLPGRYNVVSLSNCPEKASKFSAVCQAIVDACNLEKKIELISEPDTSSTRLNVNQEVELAAVKNNSPDKKKK